MDAYSHMEFSNNPAFNVVKVFFLVLIIMSLGLFVVSNIKERQSNRADVGDLLSECSDTVDNDDDGLVDYPDDTGCVDGADGNEVYEVTSDCVVNGANNDGSLRYCNEVFDQSEIVVTTGIEFSDTYNLSFDLYTPPLTDAATDRPVFMHFHGGGGESEGSASICNQYARLGYVCIGGDYRGSSGQGYTVPEQTYSASDVHALIRFIRIHAADYGIDPNKIVLGGTSAGGVTAMLAATSGNDTSNTTWFKSATKNIDNQTYTDGSTVPSWSCMVTTNSGPLSPPAYDLIDENDPPAVFFLGGEDDTHGWSCADGQEASDTMTNLGIPSYFQCFLYSGHGLGEAEAIDAIVIPTAYNELIVESCPQSYSNIPPIEETNEETYVCSDTLDNDSDTLTDYPDDPGCSSLTDDDEFNADVTVPSLSSISATPAQTGATITWNTDEASSSSVQYGLTTSYGSTTTEVDTNPRVTSHTVVLAGLTSSTLYHYRVLSTDASGNTATSTDKTFTTTAQPPATPSIISSTPASGGNNNTPKLKGTTDSGSTISIYTNAFCTGTAVATGSATLFTTGVGITVNVIDNATTVFYAKATKSSLDSSCSSGFTYVEVTPGSVACSDTIDNDGDLLIDFPNDLGCTDANDTDETDPAVVDNESPTVPQNFQATDTTESSVTFSWDIATDNSGGPLNYILYLINP